MPHRPIFAGFELSPTQSFFFTLMFIAMGVVAVLAAGVGLWVVIQTILAFKRPVAKNGFKRRKVVLLIWVVVILSVGSVYAIDVMSKNRSHSYNQSLSVAYARTYKHPVILPKTQDYTVVFDQKWGHLEVYSPANTSPAFLIQVPLTDVGRKYFDVTKGICNFDQMREDREFFEVEAEKCSLFGETGGFKVYESKDDWPKKATRYYAAYKDVVIQVNASSENIMDFVADMKVTDSNELISVFESDKFNGSYPAVLDKWHKEGRF
jgi:hypothetical protein